MNEQPKVFEPIARAIEAAGGTQSALARKAGLSQPSVRALLYGISKPTPKTALKIESGIDGAVKRWELCPDIWQPPQDSEIAA